MLHLRYRIAAPVYAIHYTYKQGSSQYLTQATFVAYSTGIENSDKGKFLAPCGNLPPATHPLTHTLPITPHIVRQRGVPVTFELTSPPNSILTEAILPYILASLKCAPLNKVKIHFPFVSSLTAHIAIRKKAVFGHAMQGGRGGGFSDGRKGNIPFQTLKCLILRVLAF